MNRSSILKNFIVLEDLEQYRSSTLGSTIKLLWTMNIYLSLYYQAMSTITATTVPHTKIEADLGEKNSSSNNNRNNHRYFALCNSCFWCASYLRHMSTIRCPSCKTEIMESMPIGSDERFFFQYDRKRGVSLQFLTV